MKQRRNIMATLVNAHHCVPLVPIFKNLTPAQSQQIEAIVRHRHVPAQQILYQAGDAVDALTIVAKGQVKVVRLAENGKEHLLYLLQSGDINGEAALFNQLEHHSTATTLTPTTVCTIARVDFQQLLTRNPQIAVNVMNALGSRLLSLEAQATKTNTESVAERLADYLVETSASLQANPFTLPLKNKDLATLLGTTPETISRYLKRWESHHLVKKLPGHQLQILDAAGLTLIE